MSIPGVGFFGQPIVEIVSITMMQREDTSKTILNKSATAEIAAAMAASGASFGRQVAPVFFLASIFSLNFIARVILSPLLPTIEKELAIGHGQAGLVTTADGWQGAIDCLARGFVQ